MGSFRAILKCEGEEFDVLYTGTKVYREIGPKGKVTTGLRGGHTEVRIEANNSSFWAEKTMNSQHKTFDFEIEFKQAEDEAEMQTIKGSHCYVVDFNFRLDTRDKEQANIYMKFVSRELTIGGAHLDSGWINVM